MRDWDIKSRKMKMIINGKYKDITKEKWVMKFKIKGKCEIHR